MRLSSLFSDHAVLQRNRPIPVWGTARPGAPVRASLGPVAAGVVAGADGRFLLRLPPLPAGGPYELRVEADGETSVARDVLVGEVWIASGQSNMEWTLATCGEAEEATIRGAALPAVRMLTAPRVCGFGRASDIDAGWIVSSPETAAAFSAVGWHFAVRLHRELGVPVGILNASWGGTIVEAWTSREALIRNPATRNWVESVEARVHALSAGEGGAEGAEGPSYPADPGNDGLARGWAGPAFDDRSWGSMELPSTWQTAGQEGSGVFWFRRTVEIPAAWAGRDLTLKIGAVDKQDITWWNGEPVGATGKGLEEQHWNTLRAYTVPGRLVKAGRTVIAVRAYSFVHSGGLIGPAWAMNLGPDGAESLPLAGPWRWARERDFGIIPPMGQQQEGPGNPNTPGILYDQMIAPLVPYALRGAIWYQGESNVPGTTYRRLLADMIDDWRRVWGQGDFPFLLVQLANFMAPAAHQAGSGWARLREAQFETLAEPETGMAVTIDIGEGEDIHPKNKKDVGHRLAQWALARTYGRDLVPSGPLYSGMTIEGDRVRLRFAHAGKALRARGGPLKTFFLAGRDRNFREAMAEIEGETVIVRHPEVRFPAAVRYAWADNPEGCNLENDAGLPASPFRTDRW